MSSMLIHVDNVPMAIAESDRERVIENLRELKDDVWELKSENTKRAYQYDFNQYLAFCKDNALLAMSSDINVTKESHHTPKNCFSALFYWGERITRPQETVKTLCRIH